MYKPLARLRPEKFDDAAIQKQILLIQEICGDINLDIIAMVFHECDYNIQNTITRIKAGDFEDGGWQTAKSNNKKKNNNNNLTDQILNGNNIQSDSERSLSQHTSPTPSHRENNKQRHQQNHYSLSLRTNHGRRRNDSGRNQFNSSNLHRNYSNNNKSLSNKQNSNEIISKINENSIPLSSSIDDDVFILDNTQTLTCKKSSIKRSIPPSSIPQVPVLMHSIIQYSTEPIDIQFGDIQWNDSIPIVVSPSMNSQSLSTITNINNNEQQTINENNLSLNYETTNNIDRDLRLSSCSISSSSSLPITDMIITNNPTIVSVEETSHLSDHLTDSLQKQQTTTSSSSLVDTTDLPLISTSHNNNSLISNNFQQSLSNTSNGPDSNSSAFTPYNTLGTYPSLPRDYPQATSTWNQQPTNYKTTPKVTILPPGNYSQQPSYQIPPQQQFFVGAYPYHPSAIYPFLTQVDSWSTTGFETYPTYPTTNYMPTYTTQQSYHPVTIQSNKYDRSSYDKDFFTHYGQTRLSNNDLLNSSQTTTKDPTPTTSKLSANAASFSQGAPLTTANPTTAYYFNPVLYTLPTYYTSHHDRSMTYSSIDSRDNRNGASYAGNNNRNHHYHQQRTHNNSTWHSQQ
ncbi:unnamed protein product [Rotaria sp. Silwood1]|nr:unnamed protein product [Rotaria sp. Silwood1]